MSSLQSGWKQLKIQEDFDGAKMETEARHVNDGLLRLMAVVSAAFSENKFLLFDEIENGINPELVEFILGPVSYTHLTLPTILLV